MPRCRSSFRHARNIAFERSKRSSWTRSLGTYANARGGTFISALLEIRNVSGAPSRSGSRCFELKDWQGLWSAKHVKDDQKEAVRPRASDLLSNYCQLWDKCLRLRNVVIVTFADSHEKGRGKEKEKDHELSLMDRRQKHGTISAGQLLAEREKIGWEPWQTRIGRSLYS